MRVEVGWGDLEEIIQSQRELKPRELERTETSYLHELKHPIRIKITDINNPFRVKNLKTRYFQFAVLVSLLKLQINYSTSISDWKKRYNLYTKII